MYAIRSYYDQGHHPRVRVAAEAASPEEAADSQAEAAAEAAAEAGKVYIRMKAGDFYKIYF